MLHDRTAILLNQLMHDRRALVMDALCTVLLAQTNGHHLHQAALVATTERSMGLDAVKQDDTVGLHGVLVHENRLLADAGQANLYGLHRALDRAAHVFLGDAVVLQNLGLAFCRCATMAAHSCNDVRLCALGLDKVYDCACHHSVMVDAAAAAGDCDAHARLNLTAQRLAGQFVLNGLDNLVLRDVCVVKHLANLHHLRYRYVLNQIGNGFQ